MKKLKNSKITTVIILIIFGMFIFGCESNLEKQIREYNEAYSKPDTNLSYQDEHGNEYNISAIIPEIDTIHDLGIYSRVRKDIYLTPENFAWVKKDSLIY